MDQLSGRQCGQTDWLNGSGLHFCHYRALLANQVRNISTGPAVRLESVGGEVLIYLYAFFPFTILIGIMKGVSFL
jgi:hypothetical protein